MCLSEWTQKQCEFLLLTIAADPGGLDANPPWSQQVPKDRRQRNKRASVEACRMDFQVLVSSARVRSQAYSPFLSLTFAADPDALKQDRVHTLG